MRRNIPLRGSKTRKESPPPVKGKFWPAKRNVLCMWLSLDPRIWLPCPASLQLICFSGICSVATRHLSLTSGPPSTMPYTCSLFYLTDHWSLITIWHGLGSLNSKGDETASASAADEGPCSNAQSSALQHASSCFTWSCQMLEKKCKGFCSATLQTSPSVCTFIEHPEYWY